MSETQVNPEHFRAHRGSTLIATLDRIRARLLAVDKFSLVLGLSLLLLIITSDKSNYMLALGLIACGAAAFGARVVRSPWFWLAIAILQAVRNLGVWEQLDDHIYVANYWSLALVLALLSPNPREIVAHNARWMIGLIFFFATFWKASTADYTSGAFFEYTLLLDDRFLPMAELCGMQSALLAENYANMDAVRNPLNSTTGFTLQSSSYIQSMAQFLTWWTVLIEGAIAACFLFAHVKTLNAVRNLLLIAFALTTYFPVPVTGFCSTLMVLGIAQTTDEERRSRIGYFVVLVLILVWTPIWRNLVYVSG